MQQELPEIELIDQEKLNEHNLKECKWLGLEGTRIVELRTTYLTGLVWLDSTDTQVSQLCTLYLTRL